MNTRKWILNSVYLVITLVTFSFSIFKWNDPVWIAAWIAPVFLIRFMRENKWLPAVVAGFAALQIAVFAAFLPLMAMVNSTSIKADFSFLIGMQARSGMLFLAPLSLAPFLLDKALHRHMPKFMATLVYPSGVVMVDLLTSYIFGLSSTFGSSQYALRPLVMTASLLGDFGLSFLVTWFSSVVNCLWEEKGSIRGLGYTGVAYVSAMAVVFILSGAMSVYPTKADKSVPIAGITLENDMWGRMSDSDLYVSEILDLKPAEYAALMGSPQSHLDEMRRKTLEAAETGAKLIVWQEYALALESSVADAYLREMKKLSEDKNIYLLVSYARILNETERKNRPEKNMGVLFTPDGEIGWEYTKAFPAPGYESHVVEAGPMSIPYVDTPFGRIGQAICADMFLPHYIRQAAAKNVDLLLVPSMDAAMFTPLYVFNSGYRAVENGFTMIRIAGDGFTAVIDPYFRLWAAHSFFEQGSNNFYADIPVVSKKTFYAGVGFVFPYAVLLLLVSLVALAIRRAALNAKSGRS